MRLARPSTYGIHFRGVFTGARQIPQQRNVRVVFMVLQLPRVTLSLILVLHLPKSGRRAKFCYVTLDPGQLTGMMA
jgi:hypothetical protein